MKQQVLKSVLSVVVIFAVFVAIISYLMRMDSLSVEEKAKVFCEAAVLEQNVDGIKALLERKDVAEGVEKSVFTPEKVEVLFYLFFPERYVCTVTLDVEGKLMG